MNEIERRIADFKNLVNNLNPNDYEYPEDFQPPLPNEIDIAIRIIIKFPEDVPICNYSYSGDNEIAFFFKDNGGEHYVEVCHLNHIYYGFIPNSSNREKNINGFAKLEDFDKIVDNFIESYKKSYNNKTLREY